MIPGFIIDRKHRFPHVNGQELFFHLNQHRMQNFYHLLSKSFLLLAPAVSPPFAVSEALGQSSQPENKRAEDTTIQGTVRNQEGTPLVGATIVGEDGSSAVAGSYAAILRHLETALQAPAAPEPEDDPRAH